MITNRVFHGNVCIECDIVGNVIKMHVFIIKWQIFNRIHCFDIDLKTVIQIATDTTIYNIYTVNLEIVEIILFSQTTKFMQSFVKIKPSRQFPN